jgi:hypothetical protein
MRWIGRWLAPDKDDEGPQWATTGIDKLAFAAGRFLAQETGLAGVCRPQADHSMVVDV